MLALMERLGFTRGDTEEYDVVMVTMDLPA